MTSLQIIVSTIKSDTTNHYLQNIPPVLRLIAKAGVFIASILVPSKELDKQICCSQKILDRYNIDGELFMPATLIIMFSLQQETVCRKD